MSGARRPPKALRSRLVLVALVSLGIVSCGSSHGPSAAVLEPTVVTPPSSAAALGPSSTTPGSVQFSDLPPILIDELPDEAIEVLVLIESGGPFPYDQDGAVFQNREELLPEQRRGYYHEYTVPTPGEDDRGPRRIVTGDAGDRYWTDDHYDSFAEIVDAS